MTREFDTLAKLSFDERMNGAVKSLATKCEIENCQVVKDLVKTCWS